MTASDDVASTLATVFRNSGGAGPVMVADGYGLTLSVRHRHLAIHDGVGPHRRTRLVPRGQRSIRRIVVLGHTGTITLDAVRWCTDVGIALLQIDTDGRVLMLANTPGRTDARLLRAQAAAASSQVGLTITQHLLNSKLTGQADLTDQLLNNATTATAIRAVQQQLHAADSLPACRELEARAANLYFAGWAGQVQPRFARIDQPRVPAAWRSYRARSSALHTGGRSPRNAADPVNALLNYGYALAEAECRLALLTVGLDPSLGIVHTDQKARDSLALDLLEPLRPVVERHVLRLLAGRTLRARDFTETRDGRCRLLPPLTHSLAEQLGPELTRTVAQPAEAIAHLLAGSSPNKISLRTPLSRANTTNAQTRGTRSQQRRPNPPAAVRPSCQQCGTDLYGSARKLCPSCWSVTRNSYLAQYHDAQRQPAKPAPPTVEELSGGWSFTDYQTRILPRLAHVPLPDMQRATGLSNGGCSRIRRGQQIPNPKHWAALAAVAELPATSATMHRGAGKPSGGEAVR